MSKILIDNTEIPYTKVDLDTEGILWRFRNLSHILEFTNLRRKKKKRFSNRKDSNQSKDYGFNSHNSLKEAIDEAKIRKMLPEEVRKLILIESQTSHRTVTDEGGVISIPEYLSNQPEYFETFVPRNRLKMSKKKGEKIFISSSVLAGVTPEKYEKYLLDCILDIYTNYHNPEVILAFISKDINSAAETFKLYIEIPPYEMNSIMRMSFTDFYRRIIFFIREQCRTLNSSYGSAISDSDIDCKYKYYTFYND
jgi:hypothetical protein